ncbi:MAG TPA: DsrE/DsrF/DrsH-like family protein, partial [Desulfobacteria bacterium]|nr:DsrE/DsrF/DrsH-like family protein [Desulfobacteria bacterium]
MSENTVREETSEPQKEALSLEHLSEQIEEIKGQLQTLAKGAAEDKLSLIVFSGDLDKALASFIIATGATAMGMDVVM